MSRTPTVLDAIAEDYVRKLAALEPEFATDLGIPGYDDKLSDYSPAGLETVAQLNRETLEAIAEVPLVDDVDRVTLAAMQERLGLQLEMHEAGEDMASLNVIASPLQGMRHIFDMMPQESAADWANIAARLAALPGAMRGYIESLREASRRGLAPAARQVNEGIKQAGELASAEGFFGKLVAAGIEKQTELTADLESGAAAARAAYGELEEFLTEELLPLAGHVDGVGAERYQRFSRYFLGEAVDLIETYNWGVEELRRVIAEQEAVAAEIAGPGATVADAVALIESDPKYTLHGVDNLQKWMQTTSDQAVTELAGVQFDIPQEIRTLECMIAPTQDGGIYYTGPSDDLSRPGRMWWSVPPGVTTFGTWREKTTVYHEGVPGHHLQIATAVISRDELNWWRRQACFVSGHAEGWALYAERLMDELGYLSDPADKLGMLDGQRMRAARVVFDIGMHLGLEAPEEWGGRTWDADLAWEFLKANVNMPEEFIRFEYNRYLGWPGQAPAYKIGQRLWEETRDAARAAAEARGEEFDVVAFHRHALRLGALPLSVLKGAILAS
jgi:uncharacterized protein (DUF885 family)